MSRSPPIDRASSPPMSSSISPPPRVSPRGKLASLSPISPQAKSSQAGGSRSPNSRRMSPSRSPIEPIDVGKLQREMVQSRASHASEVVKEFLRIPEVNIPVSDDPSELRSNLLQLRAKLHSYANHAEQACYEVERRWRAEMVKAESKKDVQEGSAIVSTGAKPAQKSPTRQGPLIFEADTPEASPIPLLDAINDLISAQDEEEGWDLLKDDVKRRGTHSTVGIRIAHGSNAQDLRPLQIQIIIPGSAAHICDQLGRGDEIIAVDGRRVDESTIVTAVKGRDIVGSKVQLTVRKGGHGQAFNVSLVRGAWGAVERKEALFILFEELVKLVEKKRASHDEIMKVLTKLIYQAKENEKFRTLSEMRIHDRLQDLQDEMKKLLLDARRRCMSLLMALSSAQNALKEQAAEMSIPLHERVEDYVRKLQQELAEAHAAREEAESKVDASQKWMEAMRGMEALAAFSRRKIKKWEEVYATQKSPHEKRVPPEHLIPNPMEAPTYSFTESFKTGAAGHPPRLHQAMSNSDRSPA
mmetsp:Transcript_7808/g.19518  ORF Transcript_7808/g.19518 Transcript_7808/m.19518 type:complete len:527 (-) Transcript_7808:326-1906(-)